MIRGFASPIRSMDKKRIILIIAFIVVCILLGFAIFWVFFADREEKPAGEAPTTSVPGQFPSAGEGGAKTTPSAGPGQLPVAGPGGVAITPPSAQKGPGAVVKTKQLTDAAILTPFPDSAGAAKFYNQSDGKFYRLDENGSAVLLSDTTFFNVKDVTWSPQKNESIIEYPDGSNIYYNFDTKKQVTLPKHWEEFDFAENGSSIAAKSIGFSEENRWLIASDPEGKNVSLIEPLGNNAHKVIVDWSPNQQIVALARTGESLGNDRQEVLLVGQYGENFKSIVVEGRDLKTLWSPSGNKLLHSVHSARSDFKPELWIVNASGATAGSDRKLLNVNTWADKCVFADDRFAYCAVPAFLNTGAGFAPGLADTIPDQLFYIDTETGIKKQIKLDDVYTVKSLFLSGDGKTLYVTDKNKTGLFSVIL